MRMLHELPPDEREYIERHVRAMPRYWDNRKIPKLLIPEQLTWWEHYKQNKNRSYDKPLPMKYVTFEYMRINISPPPYPEVRLALVANEDIIVKWV